MSFLLNIERNSYGLKHENSNLMIGEIPVTIKKNVLDIEGTKFNLTKGLAELLTKREPKNFEDDDILSYKRILTLSNAHKRRYGSVFRIKPSKSWKYENIISKLFPPKRKRGYVERRSGVSPAVNCILDVLERSEEKHEKEDEEEEVDPKGLPSKLPNMKVYNNNEAVDYVYWNKPKELVARLRLLWCEKMAGHTGHDNEILNIIDELREEGIIY